MKRIVLSAFLLLCSVLLVNAQRYYTKTGKIYFDATSPSSPDRVEATNRTATCVTDLQTGVIQFAMLMKGFEFEKALMQEHFNENYMESNKFPKAEFKGKIKDINEIDITKDGTYKAKVKGDLTIHGQTKEVETEGRFVVKGGKISADAEFSVKLSDFNISIPGLVADKIAKTAKITVSCQLEVLKN
ncbi:MAG TPA: YceI family protein [Chitinophagaceae bacterium]|nr:YceI family protein [Chitinophagaceae bacterium]